MSKQSLVLDANLLLLLVVGSASRAYISKHKRLKGYSEEDFDLLIACIKSAEVLVLTPNTLTEASNLLGYGVEDPMREDICRCFQALVQATGEKYLESKRAVRRKEFIRLGLTDSVLLEATLPSHTLLTADRDLYDAACNQGANAKNFNHLRDARG